MVAKISSGKSLFGVLNYNKLKVDSDEAKVLVSRNMFERADGSFSQQLCMQSFEPYLTANRRTENPILHISLNPDPKDQLTNEQLIEIADRYMEQMGYQNQPYVVFQHNDIDRMHLHVVSVRVDEAGKKIDSNFENRRSMAICREIEKDYGLHTAQKREQTDNQPLKKIDYKRGDVKHHVGNMVRALVGSHHFQSVGELRTMLELLNITVEEVKGEHQGKPYTGLIYSATDDNGKRVGTPFKASLFDKSIGYEAILKRFEQSAEFIKTGRIREQLRPVIADAMKLATSLENFKLLVKEKNIGVVFRKNDAGRIYGATFFDHKNQVVINGSRLGKEFSANVFNDLFCNSQVTEKQVEQPPRQLDWEKIPHVMEKQAEQPPRQSSFEQASQVSDAPQNATRTISNTSNESDLGSTIEDGIESALGIFSIDPNGTDPEEEAFRKRGVLQQQKKKRGRSR